MRDLASNDYCLGTHNHNHGQQSCRRGTNHQSIKAFMHLDQYHMANRYSHSEAINLTLSQWTARMVKWLISSGRNSSSRANRNKNERTTSTKLSFLENSHRFQHHYILVNPRTHLSDGFFIPILMALECPSLSAGHHPYLIRISEVWLSDH